VLIRGQDRLEGGVAAHVGHDLHELADVIGVSPDSTECLCGQGHVAFKIRRVPSVDNLSGKEEEEDQITVRDDDLTSTISSVSFQGAVSILNCFPGARPNTNPKSMWMRWPKLSIITFPLCL
jgi:hypothetical protein